MGKVDFKKLAENEDLVSQVLKNPDRVRALLAGGGATEGTIKISDLSKMSLAEIANLQAAQEKPRKARKAAPQAEDAPRRGRPPGSKNKTKKEGKGGNLWGRTGAPTSTADARKRLETATNERQIEALNAYIAEHGRTPPSGGGKPAPEPVNEKTDATGAEGPPAGVREHVLGRIKTPATVEECQAMLRSAQHQRGDNKKPRLVAALQSVIEEFKTALTNEENKATRKIARQARATTRAAAKGVGQGEDNSSKSVAHG